MRPRAFMQFEVCQNVFILGDGFFCHFLFFLHRPSYLRSVSPFCPQILAGNAIWYIYLGTLNKDVLFWLNLFREYSRIKLWDQFNRRMNKWFRWTKIKGSRKMEDADKEGRSDVNGHERDLGKTGWVNDNNWQRREKRWMITRDGNQKHSYETDGKKNRRIRRIGKGNTSAIQILDWFLCIRDDGEFQFMNFGEVKNSNKDFQKSMSSCHGL